MIWLLQRCCCRLCPRDSSDCKVALLSVYQEHTVCPLCVHVQDSVFQSVFSYLQNVRPPLLIENIVLEVFSVYLLRLLDLFWGHYLSWRGGGRKKEEAQEGSGRDGETHTDREKALECYSTVHCCNSIRSIPCMVTRRLYPNTHQPPPYSSHFKFLDHRNCCTQQPQQVIEGDMCGTNYLC